MPEMKTLTINGTKYVITDAEAARFTSQKLTEEQKAQARANIGAISSVDWNAAEGEPGHIQNRTHWVEKVDVALLPETNTVTYTHDQFGQVWAIEQAPRLEVGTDYRVVYNGVSYVCECKPAPAGFSEDTNAVAMGNFAVAGGENTGEPFAMLISTMFNRIDVIDLSGATSVKLGIFRNNTDRILAPTKLNYGDDGLELPIGVELLEGETYVVNWNGVEYTCVAQYHSLNGESAVYVGDLKGVMAGTPTTSEPFVIAYIPELAPLGIAGLAFDMTGNEDVTLGLSKVTCNETVHKLDNKYLDLAWIPHKTPRTVIPNSMLLEGQGEFSVTGFEQNTLYVGRPLTIYWDGIPWDMQMQTLADAPDIYFVGNVGIVEPSLSNTGEPFIVACSNNMVMVIAADGGQHEISIQELKAEAMPIEFLPDTVLHLDKSITTEQQSLFREKLEIDNTISTAIGNVKAVSYSPQGLNDAQKSQARINIGAITTTDIDDAINDIDAVRYHTIQELTEEEKTVARYNIGATAKTDIDAAINSSINSAINSSINSAINSAINDIDAVRYHTAQNLTEEQKIQARTNIGAAKEDTSVPVEPAVGDVPLLFFGASLAQDQQESSMTLRYASNTADEKCWCKTVLPDGSSVNDPKKDQLIKLYSDTEYTQDKMINLGGWGERSEFLCKANWNDASHIRSLLTCRLWKDILKLHHTGLPYQLLKSPTMVTGDGFPIRVYADSIYQGRYTLHQSLDATMANMDSMNEKHGMFSCKGGYSSSFRGITNFDSDWHDRVRDQSPESIVESWKNIVTTVADTTSSSYGRCITEKFELDVLIDYYILGLISCSLDAYSDDQVYLTYNGFKWYPTVWGADTSWGLARGGVGFIAPDTNRSAYTDFVKGFSNRLYTRLETVDTYVNKIKTRWALLREGALSMDNIILRLEQLSELCPPHIVQKDWSENTANGEFTSMPLHDDDHVNQILNFARARREWLDSYVDNIDVETPATTVYKLSAPMTFNGISDQLDTGLQLLNQDRDFTIVMEGIPGGEQPLPDGISAVFGVGDLLQFKATSADYSYILHSQSVDKSHTVLPKATDLIFRAVIWHSAGSSTTSIRIGYNGSVVDGSRNTEVHDWTNSELSLILGSDGLGHFWKGTINRFEVFDQLPTALNTYNIWLRETGQTT